jgi:glycerol 2-dehydrogenase (NADP+)
MHWPAPMTKDLKADKSHDWLDTWKTMEQLYEAHPDKIKAIGELYRPLQWNLAPRL